MSIIAAGNTINTGLTYSADQTGSLQLQTLGTTAVTYDTNQNATHAGSISSVNTFGYKNRIINGAMVIDQRNNGASVTGSTGNPYTVDRWAIISSVNSKFTAQQNAGSVTPPAGFTNYLGITSSSAYTVGASEQYTLRQTIEAYNVNDLAWGTANAKTVTLSFQVYSSLTGTFGGTLFNYNGSRNYPFSYTISSANTWTAISVTIAGDTTGTWAGTNGAGIGLQFGLGVGSTLSGTAGVWSSTYYGSATGATSVVGTNGATFYITGVQLEVGTKATPFDYREYGAELRMCQRYYEIGGSGNGVIWSGITVSGNTYFATIKMIVNKRATPTITTTNVNASGFPSTASTVDSGSTTYNESRLQRQSNGSFNSSYYGDSWTASAEL
jgi:hypothetical protein